MSGPHPTISAWTRPEHDGFYAAELHDWKLRVDWSPNTDTTRGSFSWAAEREGQKPQKSHGSFEEMEDAMADAEQFARDAQRRARAAQAAASEGLDESP